MSKNNHKRITDITGIELKPGQPDECRGNGKHGFECCCDECDFYLLCFPEFCAENKGKNGAENIPSLKKG